MIELLKGRNGLNNWLCLKLQVSNYFEFELSLFGYGIKLKYILHKVKIK